MKKALAILLVLNGFLSYTQCTLTLSTSATNVTCGDSLNIVANGQYSPYNLTENFNNNALPNGWTLGGSADFTNPCGPSLDGSPSLWMGNTVSLPRVMVTQAYDVSSGGQICFDFDFAGDENNTDCEDPDAANEGVYFRYSIDAGATWVDIFYFQPNSANTGPYYNWGNYCFPIPAAAQTTSTIFNFSQDANSSNTWDHWGIDNFSLQTNTSSGPAYYFLLDNSPFDGDTMVFSLNDEVYTIEYTNGIDDTCSATLTTTIVPFDPNFVYDPDTVCTGEGIVWSPTFLGSTGGYFSASPSGILIDSVSGVIDYQNSVAGQYSITYQSTNSSCPGAMSQMVQILDSPILFAGNDTIVQANTPFSLTAYNPSGTPIAWSGGISDGVPFSLNTGVYYFIVNTTAGCPSPDTIQVISGNPTINSSCNLTTVPSTVAVECGDSVNIVTTAQNFSWTLNYDFNNSMLPSGWTVSGTPEFDNPCTPSLDGSPTVWMGSGVNTPRSIITEAFDVQCGGQVCFDIDFAGDELSSTSCEDPDAANEGVFFRYSTDMGASWVDIFYFQPNFPNTGPYYNWGNYCFTLPPGAQSQNTIFSFSQDINSSANYDHWGIDNFDLYAGSCSASNGYYYLLDNSAYDGDTTIFTNVNHTYIIEYTNGYDDTCTAQVDVTVNPFTAGIAYNPDTICTSQSINWTPLVTGSTTGYFSASPGGLLIDSLTGNIDYANSPLGQYSITYQSTNPSCSGGASFTVNILDTPILFAGNDTIVEANLPFSLSAYNPSGWSIVWSGGITDGVPFTLSPGTYQYVVSFTSQITGCPSSDTIIVTAVNPPIITAIITHDDGTSNGAIDATITTFGGPVQSILWSNAEVTEDIVGLPASDYTITVTDSFGLVGSNTFTVLSTVGMENLNSLEFDIFPNPANNSVHLTSSTIFDFELFDSAGKLVFSGSGESMYQIEVKNWAPGLYFVEARTGENLVKKKLVVE